MNLVEVNKLSKVYRIGNNVSVNALSNVDIQIQNGEFTAIVGPSGSGKTTLLNLIGGLDRTEVGNVILNGEDLFSLTPSQLSQLRLKKIGFVFQAYNLIPVLTACENVEFVMMLQGISTSQRRERAEKILDKVGLKDVADRRPSSLSGGQQQRVAVARAIVTKPDVILADEPTANLDSETGRQLLDLMRHLNEEENMTFIFSTHDPMVMEYARRIVRLHDGRIEADETN